MSEPILVPICSSHIWGHSYDNERVICLNCECSPLSWEAKERCIANGTGTQEEA